MCRLKQAGKLAHKDIKSYLKSYQHHPVPFTPGLWIHKPTNLTFTLIVDDFRVKFTNVPQAKHLIDALETKCYLLTGQVPCIMVSP